MRRLWHRFTSHGPYTFTEVRVSPAVFALFRCACGMEYIVGELQTKIERPVFAEVTPTSTFPEATSI